MFSNSGTATNSGCATIRTESHGTLTITAGLDAFEQQANDLGISKEALAELIVTEAISVADGVEITINSMREGSVVVGYGLMANTSDLLQIATRNLEDAVARSDIEIMTEAEELEDEKEDMMMSKKEVSEK